MTRLRQRRRQAGLTAQQLADRSGVHINTILGVETGKVSAPTEAVATRLAAALGCDVTDLFDRLAAGGRHLPVATVRALRTCAADGCDQPAGRQWCADHTPLLARWPLFLPDVPDRPAPGWERRAACRDMDPDLFFPEYRGPVRPADEVVLACGRCPVRGDCLSAALKTSPEADDGVWGGTSPADRRRLRRRRRAA